MLTIQNDILAVTINPRGAELVSIYNKTTGLEYMWNADPAYWAKTSPVLFPIIGSLKNDTYYFEGKPFRLGRHGFAREKEFAIAAHSGSSAVFSLSSDDSTRQMFPFDFELSLAYHLDEDRLALTYVVQNTGADRLYFSIGGHPAFKVPLVEGSVYNDHYLEFNQPETTGRWPLSKDGLIEKKP